MDSDSPRSHGALALILVVKVALIMLLLFGMPLAFLKTASSYRVVKLMLAVGSSCAAVSSALETIGGRHDLGAYRCIGEAIASIGYTLHAAETGVEHLARSHQRTQDWLAEQLRKFRSGPQTIR